MDSDIQAYEAAQESWTEAKKVSDKAYAAKLAAQKRLNRLVVNIARIQEGYYRMAGLDNLADRMRLTIRSSKSKKQNAVDSADDSDNGSNPGDVPPSLPPATDDSPTP